MKTSKIWKWHPPIREMTSPDISFVLYEELNMNIVCVCSGASMSHAIDSTTYSLSWSFDDVFHIKCIIMHYLIYHNDK